MSESIKGICSHCGAKTNIDPYKCDQHLWIGLSPVRLSGTLRRFSGVVPDIKEEQFGTPGYESAPYEAVYSEEEFRCLLMKRLVRSGELLTQDPIDTNVESVRKNLLQRSQTGIQKYGVTTDRDDIDLMGWMKHLQEELLDAAVYLEAAMKRLQ